MIELRSVPGMECTPEQQAGGYDAGYCSLCERWTVHVHSEVCMNPECVENAKHDKPL